MHARFLKADALAAGLSLFAGDVNKSWKIKKEIKIRKINFQYSVMQMSS